MRDRVGELIHDFACGAYKGQEGNVSIGGDTLYSYSMPIAWRRNGLKVVNRSDSPSVTTSRHIGKVLTHPTAVELPSAFDCTRLGIQQDEIYGAANLRGGGGPNSYIRGMGYTIKREAKLDLHLVQMDSRAFQVPQYHKLETPHFPVWLRTLERPVYSWCLHLWRFMVKNPTGRRIQTKLKTAFTEDRLSQYGPWLIEKLPDHKVPAKFRTKEPFVGYLGFDGPQVFARQGDSRTRSRGVFFGSLNRKRVTEEKVWYRVHQNVLPMLPHTDAAAPLDLWEHPMLSLGSLQ